MIGKANLLLLASYFLASYFLLLASYFLTSFDANIHINPQYHA